MTSLYKKYLVKVHLVREKMHRPLINNPEAVIELVRKEIQSYDREHLVCIYLDSSLHVVAVEESSIGTLNSAPVCPREILKTAILSNAASFLAIHNHPGGSETPSDDDKRTTKVLKDAGQLLGISLVDHIIAGSDNRYFSFKEHGLL